MRAISSVASVTVHVALGAAVIFGTAKSGRSNPTRPPELTIVFPRPVGGQESGVQGPSLPILSSPNVPVIPLPSPLVEGGTQTGPSFPVSSPSPEVGGGDPGVWGIAAVGQEGPEVLTGPIPAYPELLRHARIQGHVVLEAIVDSTGRVLPESILVISATNPGFVAPARQALVATLFRPARIGGRAVPMRVRLPFEFTLRRD